MFVERSHQFDEQLTFSD